MPGGSPLAGRGRRRRRRRRRQVAQQLPTAAAAAAASPARTAEVVPQKAAEIVGRGRPVTQLSPRRRRRLLLRTVPGGGGGGGLPSTITAADVSVVSPRGSVAVACARAFPPTPPRRRQVRRRRRADKVPSFPLVPLLAVVARRRRRRRRRVPGATATGPATIRHELTPAAPVRPTLAMPTFQPGS